MLLYNIYNDNISILNLGKKTFKSDLFVIILVKEISSGLLTFPYLSLSLPGYHKEGWDHLQGGPEARNPHPNGDIRRLPEENGPYHRWLHPQSTQTGFDWWRGFRRCGTLTCVAYDEQICVIRGYTCCHLNAPDLGLLQVCQTCC